MNAGCACGLSVDSSKVINTRISGSEDPRFAWTRKDPRVELPDGLRWRKRGCECGEVYFTVELTDAALLTILEGLRQDGSKLTSVLELLSVEPD